MAPVFSRLAFAVAALSTATASKVSTQGDGLSGVINQLTTMRNSVQVLHDDDAVSYESVACHCEDETNKLSAEGTGLIPTAAALIQTSAATVEDRTAFIEKSVADLAQNRAELAEYEKVEAEQVAAWEKREAQLNADIDEVTQAANALAAGKFIDKVTQAANALAAAQTFLGSHPEIVKLVDDMNKDVTGSLKQYNQELGEETAARTKQNAAYVINRDNEKTQITTGKNDISAAEGVKAKATETLLSAESDIKKLSTQLNDLVNYCDLQANDWDKFSAKRQEDYRVLSIAINVLSCGSESCESPAPAGSGPSSFMQMFTSKFMSKSHSSMMLKQTEASKKAAIRKLVRMGESDGNKDLIMLQNFLKKDPLLGAKRLIRKIIEKLTKEAALDQGEMNVCATQLAECKTKRDFAFEHVEKTKISLEELGQSMEEDKVSLEELGQSMEEDKSEYAEKTAEWKENWDGASELSNVDIPTLISTYDKTKAQLTEEKNWLQEALLVLRKHFGVTDNNLAEGPKSSSSGLESTPGAGTIKGGRQVNNAGDTQSSGAKVVNMLQQNLDERKAQLSSLREDHIAELAGMRQQKSDLTATAAAAKARYDYLQKEIEKETALFGEKILELQGNLDTAAANGRCVQELEPCGVQMDRRAQREQEIKALKDAWTILAEGTDDQAPSSWGMQD